MEANSLVAGIREMLARAESFREILLASPASPARDMLLGQNSVTISSLKLQLITASSPEERRIRCEALRS